MHIPSALNRSMLAVAAVLTLSLCGVTSAYAQAVRASGDFSYQATAVKRLANCAASAWYNDSRVGGAINECNNADTDAKWDSVHLNAATYMEITGERVGYGNGACPAQHGFQYIKCFYVAGRKKGNPVMTVSAVSYGSGGMTARVSWYYQ